MPKAVILFSFKKDDPTPLIQNLSDLKFDKKVGRRIIFSKEFSLNEVEMDLKQLKAVKDSIIKNATIRIAGPDRIWRQAFKAAGLDSQEAVLLAGLATANNGTATYTSLTDTGDSNMNEEQPAAAQPIVAEMKQEESQSQGIVEDDFDVDALVSGLANTKLGGRRKSRRGKKLRSKKVRGTRRH